MTHITVEYRIFSPDLDKKIRLAAKGGRENGSGSFLGPPYTRDISFQFGSLQKAKTALRRLKRIKGIKISVEYKKLNQ